MALEKIMQNQCGMQSCSCSIDEAEKARIDTYNSTEGNLQGYDCPDCMNRGKFAYMREDGSVGFIDCKCLKIRQYISKMKRSGMGEAIKRFTFENFIDTEPWQKKMKQGAMEYAVHSKGWILFCGQCGCGKTHLCTAVANTLLLSGYDVQYMPWRTDTAMLKELSMTGEGAKREKYMDKLREVTVLFIDDFFKTGQQTDGSKKPTVADINIAFDIINYRYTKELKTIISTELLPSELAGIDEATCGRIVEMAGNNVFAIARDFHRDYRFKNCKTV